MMEKTDQATFPAKATREIIMTTTPKAIIISLFDYTAIAVEPWARSGYYCICVDIQHEKNKSRIEHYANNGAVEYLHKDLAANSPDWDCLLKYVQRKKAEYSCDVHFVFGFPPCTDLAVSGARHFAKKRELDPDFQTKAAKMATSCADFAAQFGAKFCVENPVSVLSTLWRAPNYKFNPCDFGGYLSVDDTHPRYPKYIAPRDAYNKETWLWTGGGFILPEFQKVEPEVLVHYTVSGRVLRGSRQFMKLGGASLRTKNIRNETPRGFALAVYQANN